MAEDSFYQLAVGTSTNYGEGDTEGYYELVDDDEEDCNDAITVGTIYNVIRFRMNESSNDDLKGTADEVIGQVGDNQFLASNYDLDVDMIDDSGQGKNKISTVAFFAISNVGSVRSGSPLVTSEFDQVDEFISDPFSFKLIKKNVADVEMEYILVRGRTSSCQSGFVELIIDNPAITEIFDFDHSIYFFGYTGNITKDVTTGISQDDAVIRHLEQSFVTAKLKEQGSDVDLFSNGNKIFGSLRFSDIDANPTKRFRLNTGIETIPGNEVSFTIVIGLRSCDFSADDGQKTTTQVLLSQNPDVFQGTSEILFPHPGDITFTFDDIKVEIVETFLDERPMFGNREGLFDNAETTVNENHILRYAYFEPGFLDINGLATTVSSKQVSIGYPETYCNDGRTTARRRSRLPSFVTEPSTTYNSNLTSLPSSSFSLQTRDGQQYGKYNDDIANQVAVDSDTGMAFQVGAFRKTQLNDRTLVLRLPQVLGIGGFLAQVSEHSVFGLPDLQVNNLVKPTSFKIGLYRGDSTNFTDENACNIFNSDLILFNYPSKALVDSMVLIKEYTIDNFHSGGFKIPDVTSGQSVTSRFYIANHFVENTIVDNFRYETVDTTVGDDPLKTIARYWLVVGSKTSNTGVFGNTNPTDSVPSSIFDELIHPPVHIHAHLRVLGSTSTGVVDILKDVVDYGSMFLAPTRFEDIP